MKPSRHAVTLNVVESFIREYFDQNPISQLGIIVTKNSRAEKITELSGMWLREREEREERASSNSHS